MIHFLIHEKSKMLVSSHFLQLLFNLMTNMYQHAIPKISKAYLHTEIASKVFQNSNKSYTHNVKVQGTYNLEWQTGEEKKIINIFVLNRPHSSRVCVSVQCSIVCNHQKRIELLILVGYLCGHRVLSFGEHPQITHKAGRTGGKARGAMAPPNFHRIQWGLI